MWPSDAPCMEAVTSVSTARITPGEFRQSKHHWPSAHPVKLPGGDKTYQFAAASPYQQYQVMRDGKVFEVERRMGLTSSVRMVFDALEAGKTRVAVSTVYILTRDQSVVGGANSQPLLLNDTISFNSGETGTFPHAKTKCQPTGKLEAELLSLLK